MSQLFFHHVGRAGAERDFRRSLAHKIKASAVVPSLRTDLGSQRGEQFAADLGRLFPSGFNCWAPPAAADKSIASLEVGDIVLLIGAIQLQPFADGAFDYLGKVRVKSVVPLHETSRYIWTEAKFPWLFFFEATKIKLPWPTFLTQVGYRPNFDPRGLFYRVNPKRYGSLPGGDPDGYARYVMAEYPG